MFRKLQILLKETDSKLLFKYDGERIRNQYTIKLIFNDLRLGSSGKDTDEPYKAIREIFDKQDLFSADDALELYSKIAVIIKSIDLIYGKKTIITIMLGLDQNQISYNYYIETKDFVKHGIELSLKELEDNLFNN